MIFLRKIWHTWQIITCKNFRYGDGDDDGDGDEEEEEKEEGSRMMLTNV